ncbi:MAG: DUF1958 domain-containing protein [Lachnospiraceae bacterium]
MIKLPKYLVLLSVLLIFSQASPLVSHAQQSSIEVARSMGNSIDQRYAPAGSIITEVHTGQILWSENIDTQWTPASMSKLMTIALAYDAVKTGRFDLDTKVPVTQKYIDISQITTLSNNKMQPGCEYTIGELIDLIITPSSAAATYMLADFIESDLNTFIQMLNNKAASLKMTNTHYVNPIGVPNSSLGLFAPPESNPSDDNYTTSKDYALLCTYLIENHPDILNHTKYRTIVVKQGTPFEETFTGYNHSLEGAKHAFPGVDGIKTGSADKGYNYSLTAQRGDTRLVEIVLGVSVWEDTEAEYIRHLIGNAILEDAFNNYEYRMILDKGEYEIEKKKVILSEPFYDCVPKNWEQSLKWDFKNNVVTANLERTYLPGYSAPTGKISLLSLEKNGRKSEKHTSNFPPLNIVTAFFAIILLGVVGMIASFLYRRRLDKIRKDKRRKRP